MNSSLFDVIFITFLAYVASSRSKVTVNVAISASIVIRIVIFLELAEVIFLMLLRIRRFVLSIKDCASHHHV